MWRQSVLETEIAYFEQHLPELLAKHPGDFVVIKDQQVVAFCDTVEEALAEGARRFGIQSFLVRRIQRTQAEESVPALTLGLLGAYPSHTVFGPGDETGR